MISAQKVSLQYADGTMALRDISLQIEAGELVYIIGPSGSGKTSLLKLMMGAEFPTEGSLHVLGHSVTKEKTGSMRMLRRSLGPVFQDFRLIKGRTSLENVMMGLRFLDLSAPDVKENATDALLQVGMLHKKDALVENLSWGECQRVSIARAVARKPALILADEPTGNLDKDNALHILELLTSFKDNKTAVVITTHATHLISENSGRVIALKGGMLERAGETA